MKKYYLLLVLSIVPSFTIALTRSAAKSYPLDYKNKKYEVYPMGNSIGQLNDGTWVKLVCIKKGMIGMPNISMASYRGMYTNKNSERCYVFVLKAEGNITFNNQTLAVYRGDDEEGFLSDGTKVKIECLAPGAVAKIAVTPHYRGTYYLQDSTGDKQQCHVWAVEKEKTTSQLQGIGTGFRS